MEGDDLLFYDVRIPKTEISFQHRALIELISNLRKNISFLNKLMTKFIEYDEILLSLGTDIGTEFEFRQLPLENIFNLIQNFIDQLTSKKESMTQLVKDIVEEPFNTINILENEETKQAYQYFLIKKEIALSDFIHINQEVEIFLESINFFISKTKYFYLQMIQIYDTSILSCYSEIHDLEQKEINEEVPMEDETSASYCSTCMEQEQTEPPDTFNEQYSNESFDNNITIPIQAFEDQLRQFKDPCIDAFLDDLKKSNGFNTELFVQFIASTIKDKKAQTNKIAKLKNN